MATHSKWSLNARTVFIGLLLSSTVPVPVQAALVKASSDIVVNNLRFSLGDSNAQFQWVDEWYAEVRAHAADSDSFPSDDFNSFLGNDGGVEAIASTAHVSSNAKYVVENGDQIGIESDAGVTGRTHSDLHLERPNMQADGFAITNFDNFFKVTNPNPDLNSVLIDFFLDYKGTLYGEADEAGFFVDITHIASLLLYDEGGLLAFDFFEDSISGTNTTIVRPNQGTLRVSYELEYGKTYWLFAEADSEIYGYTVPAPAVLPLLLSGLVMMRYSRRHKTRTRSPRYVNA